MNPYNTNKPNSVATTSAFSFWHYQIGVFVIVTLSLLLFGYHGPGMGGDADVYWGLASRFRQAGHISVFFFDSPLRGYLFPLLLFLPKALVYLGGFPQAVMNILLGALVAGPLFGWVLPSFYQAVRAKNLLSPLRQVLFAGMGLFFWGGYFNYTLSDFPGLLFLAGSLTLLLIKRQHLVLLVLAGVLFGAALNVRPVYIISLPFLILLSLLVDRDHSWAVRLRTAALVALGIALPLLPQWQINRLHFGRSTPFVLTQVQGERGSDLLLSQLGWGLESQKFESAFRSAPGRVNGLAFYLNPEGQYLLNKAGYQKRKVWGPTFKSFAEYIILLRHHPVGLMSVYARNLFNGLDQHHSTPYIRQPIKRFTWILPIVNYSLWFGTILLLWNRRRAMKKISSVQASTALVWLLPSMAACLMAMENRFLLPVHLLIYAALCFEWKAADTHVWWGRGRLGRLLLVVSYLVFMGGCFVFSWSIHQHQFLIK